MAFSWSETIGVGEHTESVDLAEIKSNVDWLDDNAACPAYNASIFSSEDVTYYGANNGTVDVDHNTGVNTSDYNYCSGHNSGVDVDNSYIVWK